MENRWQHRKRWQKNFSGMSYLIHVGSQSWTFVKVIFHGFYARFLCRAAGWFIAFWQTRRTFPTRGLSRKLEFQPLQFHQQITHETFAEYPARVTTTLNNFPIAEINKTIVSINKRVQLIKASKGERSKY